MSAAETQTFRPRRLRVLAYGISALLTAGAGLGWVALPEHLRATFTIAQILTLLALLGLLVTVLLAVGTSYVRADAEGLQFRNGLRRHRVGWDRVHKVLLRPGDPWALVLLTPADGSPFRPDLDAEKHQLMGIQAGDGDAARRAVQALRDQLGRVREGSGGSG